MTCVITAISCVRVNLTLIATFAASDCLRGGVQFKVVDGERSFPVKTTPSGDGRYRPEINYVDGQPHPAVRYNLSAIERLDADSRTFLYAANTVAHLRRVPAPIRCGEPAMRWAGSRRIDRANQPPSGPWRSDDRISIAKGLS